MISVLRSGAPRLETWAQAFPGLLLLGLLGGLLEPPLARADSPVHAPPEAVSFPVLISPATPERNPGAWAGSLTRLSSPGSPMIRIAQGQFWMGSSELELIDAMTSCEKELGRAVQGNDPLATSCRESVFAVELWMHSVFLASFWLDRTEVTVAQYQRCVELGACPSRSGPGTPGIGAARFNQPDYPVTFVAYDEAAAFCHFRGARLPTEAEWERAARGSASRKFPWGEQWNSRLSNHGRLGWDVTDSRDGFAELAPVGSFPQGRTPDGFLDLAGNVAEWVSDWFAPEYPKGLARNPTGPASPLTQQATTLRVVRGGDWSSPANAQRGAARHPLDPQTRTPTVGFRCARSHYPQREPTPP